MIFGLRLACVGGAVAASTVAFASWPANAQGDLFLIFNRARADRHERVQAFSGNRRTGKPSAFARLTGIRVYFVPMALAKSALHQRSTGLPRSKRIIPLGPLRRDGHGVARIRFRVPDVPAGDYTTGFLCLPCARPLGAFFTSARPGERWSGRRYGVVLRVRKR